jgi:hypothetical protein
MATWGRLRWKCVGTRAEAGFHLSAKRTSPFKSAVSSVESTTGSRGVRISDSNAGYTMFRGSGKSTGYPLHSPVSPSLPLPCVIVCYHISTGLYVTRLSNVAQDIPVTSGLFRSCVITMTTNCFYILSCFDTSHDEYKSVQHPWVSAAASLPWTHALTTGRSSVVNGRWNVMESRRCCCKTSVVAHYGKENSLYSGIRNHGISQINGRRREEKLSPASVDSFPLINQRLHTYRHHNGHLMRFRRFRKIAKSDY